MTHTAPQFEVEVKVLLGDDDAAAAFVEQLRAADPNVAVKNQSSQLNHYFDQAGTREQLLTAMKGVLNEDDYRSFAEILTNSGTYALRTRQDDGGVKLVIKAAKDGEDEQHAVERLEGEYVTTLGQIDQLDALIQSAGYEFLSKWSRDRTEYAYKDYTVTVDRNAGYGFIAEFERVVKDSDAASRAKHEILAELADLGLEELSQERVGRMFKFYNEHWPEYYQTDKTFTVE